MKTKINRREIIKEIFINNFDKEFLLFIDYATNNAKQHGNGSRLEFPVNLYLNFYNKHIIPLEKPYLNNIFSLDAMSDGDNSFFSYDAQSGNLSFSYAIYEFFMWIDTERAVEYSNREFEGFREDVVKTVDQIVNADIGNEDYHEAKSYLSHLMGKIFSQINANIDVLNIRVDEIAEIYQDKENGLSQLPLDELYNKAIKLNVKNIQPCYEFTSPSTRLKNKETFTEAINRLTKFLRANNCTEDALYFQYKISSINNNYKPIGDVSRRLGHYIKNLTTDRKGYLASENIFSDLIKSLEEYRHGREKDINFTPANAFFQNNIFFSGLSDFKSSNNKNRLKINRVPELLDTQFKVHYESAMQKPLKKRQLKQRLLIKESKTIANSKRDSELFGQVMTMNPPTQTVEIYTFLNEYFNQIREDFTLPDLLYVANKFIVLHEKPNSKNNKIKRIRDRYRAEDENYFFEYTGVMWIPDSK